MKNKLQHIAIIMDGNGRWAAKKSLPVVFGHKQGAKAAKKIIIACIKFGIPYLTLYTFSSENWNRDKQEVDGLMDLLRFYLSNELELLKKEQIRIRVIGDKSKLAKDVREQIEFCEEETKLNSKLCLQIALSYGAREEIVNAQKKLCEKVICGKIKVQEVNEGIFINYLYTSGIPDPDLLIRTSGEYRISNFLLWQLAYAELYFTKTLWPDFNSTHLHKAIENYYKRERLYGLSRKNF